MSNIDKVQELLNKKRDIESEINKFLTIMEKDENGRFKSFEHFHKVFEEEYNALKPNKDKLTLHFFAYLASWGMLRGSTFALQKDYLFHKPVVEILLNKKYSHLLNIKLDAMNDVDIKNILKLSNEIKNYYKGKKYFKDEFDIDGNPISFEITNPTDTLITKILMGSFSCVPAFDQYVKKGLEENAISPKFNKESIKQLKEFYNKNKETIDQLSSTCSSKRKTHYSHMKILDMYFWQIGKNIK